MLAPAIPEVLADRYEIGPVLGRGGMGEVRRAHDRRLTRDVAVKFLSPYFAHDPASRARFSAEAKAAARISHPNAVMVFDAGEQDGTPYIVMELLPGRTLADELRSGPLEPGRARQVAIGIVSALEAAHALGVLHRDVKPANILVDDEGRARLADFGIAKTADNTEPTSPGQVLGTEAYLAPERLRGHPASARTDIYAAGVVLYEALTGQRPPAGAGRIPRADEVVPGIGANLAAVAHRAMATNPADRYATASDMLEGLRAAVVERAPDNRRAPAVAGHTRPLPLDATAPVRSRILVPGPRRIRDRWRIAAAAAVLAVGFAVVGVVTARTGDGDAAPVSAVTEPPAPELPDGPLRDAIDDLEDAVNG